jgi:hypothetical protein
MSDPIRIRRFSFLVLAGCLMATPAVAEEVWSSAVYERTNALMAELARCESGGTANPDGAYLGRFQFATATVINYVRERDGRTIGAAEARAIARDEARARDLARYVIFERNGHLNWPACSRKIGLPAKVAGIKRL